jgi:hypothetical protein
MTRLKSGAARIAALSGLMILLTADCTAAPDDANAAAATGTEAARLENLAERPVWKRITLGRYRGVNTLRAALDAARVRVGDLADEILGRPAFAFSTMPVEVDLVVLTPRDLGFAREASLADIERRAGQLGFELCPAEVGPLARLAYVEQPAGEFLRIAMKPVPTWGGTSVSLTVANGGTGPILIGGEHHPDLAFAPGTRFVFMRPERVALPDAR